MKSYTIIMQTLFLILFFSNCKYKEKEQSVLKEDLISENNDIIDSDSFQIDNDLFNIKINKEPSSFYYLNPFYSIQYLGSEIDSIQYNNIEKVYQAFQDSLIINDSFFIVFL